MFMLSSTESLFTYRTPAAGMKNMKEKSYNETMGEAHICRWKKQKSSGAEGLWAGRSADLAPSPGRASTGHAAKKLPASCDPRQRFPEQLWKDHTPFQSLHKMWIPKHLAKW